MILGYTIFLGYRIPYFVKQRVRNHQTATAGPHFDMWLVLTVKIRTAGFEKVKFLCKLSYCELIETAVG